MPDFNERLQNMTELAKIILFFFKYRGRKKTSPFNLELIYDRIVLIDLRFTIEQLQKPLILENEYTSKTVIYQTHVTGISAESRIIFFVHIKGIG